MRRVALGLCLIVATALTAAAQAPDQRYGELIREYTSDPHFLPASVATLPTMDGMPSPLDHFGTIIGAPGVMHHVDEIYGYYRALAAATPRVRVESYGTTEEGREIILVIVADEESIGRLDHYRETLARLADPRGVSDTDRDQLLRDAKPIRDFLA